MAKNKQLNNIVNDYTETLDMDLINEMLTKKDIGDFEMNKTTIMNIAEWALNGSSNEEIRKKLDLNPKQWNLLVSICPTLIYVMKSSRALADTIIAGSLFQLAIGGKRVRKVVPKSVTEYGENGRPCGQHLETIEVWEELPPNGQALMFLAQHKLSENFGKEKETKINDYGKLIDNMTPEEKAMIEIAKKEGFGDVNN